MLESLTNCVITWNTVYMAAAIDQLRREGHAVQESDLAYLSPCRCENINPYGKYDFEVNESQRGAKLRPLRPGRPPAKRCFLSVCYGKAMLPGPCLSTNSVQPIHRAGVRLAHRIHEVK